MTSTVASVVDKKVALEHETNGDLGNAWLKTNSASSGAYRLVSWKPNESVALEANPKFRLGPPANRRVVVRHVPETASQFLLLEKGDIDIAFDLSPDQLASLHGNKDIKIETFVASDNWYFAMNMADERLANPKVREALKYLVDYQGMANSFLKGRFIVNETFLPSGFLGALDYNPYKLDVDKAKQLLAEAGYPSGFELRLDAPNFSPIAEIAQSIQQTFGQAGVKMNIVPAELKAVLSLYRAVKHQQLVLVSWGPDYFDPHTNADAYARNTDDSDKVGTRTLASRNAWIIPELSKETIAAAKELDTTKRAAMYQDLERKATDEGPFIFMFQTAQPIASRADVTGFKPGITEDMTFYRLIEKKR